MARAFFVRSAERDAKSDHERIDALGRAISATLDSVRGERDALQKRVGKARDLAPLPLPAGAGNVEYLYRDPEDLTRVPEYERQVALGDRRLSELQRQLDGLAKVRETYLQFFAGSGDPAS